MSTLKGPITTGLALIAGAEIMLGAIEGNPPWPFTHHAVVGGLLYFLAVLLFRYWFKEK